MSHSKILRTLYWECIDDTGIDDCASQTKVVGVRILKSVLERSNYARSLKAIVILAHAIESLKCEAFTNNNDMSKHGEFLSSMEGFQEALSKSFAKKESKILSKSLRDLLANIRETQTRI